VDFLVMVAFWYSLGFAVVRTLLTIFVASSINDYEKKIVTALRDVPSRAWSIEVKVTLRCIYYSNSCIHRFSVLVSSWEMIWQLSPAADSSTLPAHLSWL